MISRPAEPDELEVIDRKGGMRLNTAMRSSILKKAIAHAFDKRFAEMKREGQRLGHAAMVSIFGSAKLAMARRLGPPFAVSCEDHYGRPAPEGRQVAFRVAGRVHTLLVQDPMPRHLGNEDAKFFTVKDGKLQERISAFADASQALAAERSKTETTLTAMLAGVQSFKSLQRSWPEGERFYKHLPKEFPFRHQVPATLVADLNKALGI
jgi:hypothetical protein